MRVKSAVDGWVKVVLLIALASTVTGVFTAPEKDRLVSALISGLTAALLVWILRETYYELNEDHIFCRSGPITVRIPYEQIRSVRLSNSWLSSIALSVRRIEILWNDKAGRPKTVLISPVDREDFMRRLLEKCPQVER